MEKKFIKFASDSEVYRKFKTVCAARNITVKDAFLAHMEEVVEKSGFFNSEDAE